MDLEMMCRVCDDKASGVHYGVESCEGCKGFYRRTIHQRIKYQECALDGSCIITRATRNRCQICRYRKCMNMGMSRDAVKYGRIPKKEKAKMLAERMAFHRNTMAVEENKEYSASLQSKSSEFSSVTETSSKCAKIRNDIVVPPKKRKLHNYNLPCVPEEDRCSLIFKNLALNNAGQSRPLDRLREELLPTKTTYTSTRLVEAASSKVNGIVHSSNWKEDGLLRQSSDKNHAQGISTFQTHIYLEKRIPETPDSSKLFHGQSNINALKSPPGLLYIPPSKTATEVTDYKLHNCSLQQHNKGNKIGLSPPASQTITSPLESSKNCLPLEGMYHSHSKFSGSNLPDEYSRKLPNIPELYTQRPELNESHNLMFHDQYKGRSLERSRSFDTEHEKTIPRWSLHRSLSGEEFHSFPVNMEPLQRTAYLATPNIINLCFDHVFPTSTNRATATNRHLFRYGSGLLPTDRPPPSSSPDSGCPENAEESSPTFTVNIEQHHVDWEQSGQIIDLTVDKEEDVNVKGNTETREDFVGDEILRAHNDTMCASKHAILLTSLILQEEEYGSKNDVQAKDSGSELNETQIIPGLESQLDSAAREVVEFARRIPGFVKLNQQDQLTLIKSGVFEVLVLRFASQYQLETSTLLFPNGRRLNYKQLPINGKEGFVKSTFDFAKKLHHLSLSAKEYSIFTTLPLVSSDRPGVIDVKSVDELQNKMLSVLRHEMALSRQESNEGFNTSYTHYDIAFPKLLTKLAELRTLSAIHSSCRVKHMSI